MALYKQLDLTLPKSKSKWECTCPSCETISIFHYNCITKKIKNDNFNCLSCILRKRNETLTKNPIIKEKLRQAKTGKRGEDCNNWKGGGDRVAMWQENNKDLIKLRNNTIYRPTKTASEANRRANKLNQTPKWLSETDMEEMRQFYNTAKYLSETTGIEHHVDHIIPLQGKQVRGLHVPWNLQILTITDNLKKSNKVNYVFTF